MAIDTGDTSDVWVYDLERGTRDRLTREGTNEFPAWSPDGDRIAFSSVRGGTDGFGLYWKASDGSGVAEPLLSGPFMQLLMCRFADGEARSFIHAAPAGFLDIWLLAL